jgi:SagB-type dehydrogenase family enzyme
MKKPNQQNTDVQWNPLVMLKPACDDKPQQVSVSDALNRRRARVDISALLDLLAAEYRGLPPSGAARGLAAKLEDLGWRPGRAVDTTVEKQAQQWTHRGWHPSLQYFLWSRGRPFVDAKDVSGDARRSVLEKFLADEGPPPPRVVSSGRETTLPAPLPLPAQFSFGDLLMARRSVRLYLQRAVSREVLSSLLHYGLDDVRTGRTREIRDPLDYLQSHGVVFDVYLVVFRMSDLEPGVYRYDIAKHSLIQQREGNFQEEMKDILVGMKAPETATMTLLLAADFPQYQWRYRHERALRHVYMASGRVAQRLLLVGHAFGLGTLPTPATRDTECCALLQLDPTRQAPIYTLTMGPCSIDPGRKEVAGG